MNDSLSFSSSSSSLWIENLVDGLSGLTIKAKHADFCGASAFQKIEVFDTYSYGRVLLLAGAIVLTERDEHIYSEMATHPAMLMHKDPKSVCIIGGGDGGCLREVLKHQGVEKVCVVDIDAMVKDAIETYFPALAKGFADPRATLVINDGFKFLEKTEEKFDVILVDSYDPGGPVQSLETANFYRFVSEHVAPNGIAVFQTDSPVIKGEFIRRTALGISPFFAAYKPCVCTISSFPGGVCSFLVCSSNEAVLAPFDEKRYRSIAATCRYYNKDIHTGAFLLPQHIRNLLTF